MNAALAFVHRASRIRRRPAHRAALRRLALASLAAAVTLAACGAPSPSAPDNPSPPSPSPSPSPSASPALSPLAVASPRVTAFYYLWYGTPANDGQWRHWNQRGHLPPDDIASSFYPLRGPYSSRDPAVLAAQMQELRAVGVGVAAVSWWGRGSWEDEALPALFAAAARAGVRLAFHIEPYAGRTAASVAEDIRYLLEHYGAQAALFRIARPTAASRSTQPRPVFYLFDSAALPVAALSTALAGLRGTPNDPILLVQSPRIVSATRVGADGIYTYDQVSVGPERFAAMVASCRAADLICSPSVGPGYDDREAVAKGQTVDRAGGARYDAMWRAAIAAGAEWISIASYNEWHEGTQIEPARDAFTLGRRTYSGYDGAYGASAAAAPFAYLRRTADWVRSLESGASPTGLGASG